MKLSFNDLSSDGRWFTMPDSDLEMLIRPYPADLVSFLFKDGGVVLSGSENMKRFKYCLLDWRNAQNSDGQPIKLTEMVKDTIFKTNFEGIPTFVLQKSAEMLEKKASDEQD